MGGQFNEEWIIDGVFPQDFIGYAVDVGACDGRFLNTTLALEQRGWDVLCIEPGKNWYPELTNTRKRVMQVACGAADEDEHDFTIVTMGPEQGPWGACSALNVDERVFHDHRNLIRGTEVIKVRVRTLENCIAEAGFPRVDFLTIDTEGHDMEVLKGFDVGKWLPSLIAVENWSGDDRFLKYFDPWPYTRFIRLGVNDYFIKEGAGFALPSQ